MLKSLVQKLWTKSRRHRLSKQEVEQIKAGCLRLLARREHSQLELLNKLEVKGYSVDLIKAVIDELVTAGWQSDKRFSESYIRNRIRSGYGPVRIDHELRQRGIDKTEYDYIIAELAGSWLDQIEQVYLRKYNSSRTLTANEWAKRTRFLQQRGFTFEMIKSLYDQVNISLI